MNEKIGIIVDSTTIIPEEVKDKFIFGIVPLHVTINGENRPEPEIKDQEIIDKLENCKDLKSSSPSVGEFEKEYLRLFDLGVNDILVLPMSKENSTTYNVGKMAIDLLPEDKKNHVSVLNTLINNYGIANVLIALSYWSDKDISFVEFTQKAETYLHDSHLGFTILDLKHLFRGGRLSRISCAIGLLFKIKPIIEMVDGKLVLTKKERTSMNIINYFIKQIAVFSTKYKKVYCRFIYLGNNLENINKMIEIVERTFKNVEFTIIDRVGPVFLVHLGNSGFGITLTGVNDQN